MQTCFSSIFFGGTDAGVYNDLPISYMRVIGRLSDENCHYSLYGHAEILDFGRQAGEGKNQKLDFAKNDGSAQQVSQKRKNKKWFLTNAYFVDALF